MVHHKSLRYKFLLHELREMERTVCICCPIALIFCLFSKVICLANVGRWEVLCSPASAAQLHAFSATSEQSARCRFYYCDPSDPEVCSTVLYQTCFPCL